MRVLWIVNKIMPYPAKILNKENSCLGGWLDNLLDSLKIKKIEICVVSFYSGKKLFSCKDKNVTYFLIPKNNFTKYDNKTKIYWNKILEEFVPDIIHIHGTEYPLGLECTNVTNNKKIIVSIQGLTTRCYELYYSGMTYYDILSNITIRDLLKRDTIINARHKFKKRSKYEIELLKKVKYIIGRTDWDYFNTLAINKNIKYFQLNETLREIFVNKIWNINNIERHSLFVSQGYYPIKGLHQLIKAMKIVCEKYPDCKLHITGEKFIDNTNLKSKLKRTGYAKYINKLIKKYNLENNIIFDGYLNGENLVNRMLKTHIVIVPSIVENESNTLSEAHILGIPTIAAFSGGMTNRIIHNVNGFAYPFVEYNMLAQYIITLFENDELCLDFSQSARKIALARNEKELNSNRLLEIYEEVLNEK